MKQDDKLYNEWLDEVRNVAEVLHQVEVAQLFVYHVLIGEQ